MAWYEVRRLILCGVLIGCSADAPPDHGGGSEGATDGGGAMETGAGGPGSSATATTTTGPGDDSDGDTTGSSSEDGGSSSSGDPEAACLTVDDCDPGTLCAEHTCMDGRCVAEAVNEGMECPLDADVGYCLDGACTWVYCESDDPCEVPEIDAGICGFRPLDGVDADSSWQTDGDCLVFTCVDGSGVEVPDPRDVPDDAEECTTDTCGPDGPSHGPVAAGTPCGDAGTCDEAGACVQ